VAPVLDQVSVENGILKNVEAEASGKNVYPAVEPLVTERLKQPPADVAVLIRAE
jgi:hypothetical protein